jgi:hypothetical protein
MPMKEFLVSAIGAALELGIGTADDVLKYVTPDVLSQHLPRPLWARLINACLGAPKVNAQLVVDTVGIPNLCEHIPQPIMWSVLADVGLRALGKAGTVATAIPAPAGKSAPVTGPVAAQTPPAPEVPRPRSSSRQPFRQVGTNSTAGAASRSGVLAPGSGSLAARRPQAAAPSTDRAPSAPVTPPMPSPQPASALVGSRVSPPSNRRGTTATDFDIDTDVRAESWKSKDVEVDDDQLIDWSAAEETVAGDDRKPRG